MNNIEKYNFTTIVFKHTAFPSGFALDLDKRIVVTTSGEPDRDNNQLKCWKDDGTCCWTFKANPHIYWWDNMMIKIVGGKIVCAGRSSDMDTTIRVVDLDKGIEMASITDSRIRDSHWRTSICTIGKSIFTAFENGNIGEWSLEGKLVQIIESEKIDCIFEKFLGFGDFSVRASQKYRYHARHQKLKEEKN